MGGDFSTTTAEISKNNSMWTVLSPQAVAELDRYIGWKDGKLVSGTDFSKKSQLIQGRIYNDKLYVQCSTQNNKGGLERA